MRRPGGRARWPAAGTNAIRFDYLRLCELPGSGSGGEAPATYVATRPDGMRFQNTELFGFRGDQVIRMEVSFGWDVE